MATSSLCREIVDGVAGSAVGLVAEDWRLQQLGCW